MLSFLRKLVGLSDSNVSEITPLMQNIIDDQDVLNISNALVRVSDDDNVDNQTRKDTLRRTLAYIKSAAWKNKINDETREFIPNVEQFQIIRVNFSGLGSELKDPHFSIVWDTERKRDGVVVIPLTSFKEQSTFENGKEFNIGTIGHFTIPSVVMMQQIVQISRKRILNYRFSYKTKNIIVRLNDYQKERVRDGFKVLGLGRKTLYEEIRDRAKDYLPILSDSEKQYDHLFRPFEVVETSVNQLKYTVGGDLNTYEINRKQFNKKLYNRYELIEDWAHPYPTIDEHSGITIHSREEARQRAYQAITRAIESFKQEEVKGESSA